MKLRTKDWEVIGASAAMATMGAVLLYFAHKRDVAAPFATRGYWPNWNDWQGDSAWQGPSAYDYWQGPSAYDYSYPWQ